MWFSLQIMTITKIIFRYLLKVCNIDLLFFSSFLQKKKRHKNPYKQLLATGRFLPLTVSKLLKLKQKMESITLLEAAGRLFAMA